MARILSTSRICAYLVASLIVNRELTSSGYQFKVQARRGGRGDDGEVDVEVVDRKRNGERRSTWSANSGHTTDEREMREQNKERKEPSRS